MKFRLYLLAFAAVLPLLSNGQMMRQLNAAEIKQGLEALQVTGSVLYIAAHPDDENTRLLAYLAKERKLRTGYLSLTRGDGGQNLIGNEQAELLGLIRTQELLAARRTDGAEQFFTRANDFGFSKNPEESFKIWDKQKVLADVVWVIRKFQPDVIITRFPEDSRAGHGHHSGSAILAREAFVAAADPNQFPEQLVWVKPWKTKRILWNTFNFGGNNTTSEDQLKLDVGGFNALLGESYGEIAAESRSNHRSQGFGTARQRGASTEYFVHIAGDKAGKDLFEGIDQSWTRVKGAGSVAQLITQANVSYEVSAPARVVPQLVKIFTALEALPDGYWKTEKIKAVKDLIANAAGIWFEALVPQSQYAMNQQIPLSLQVVMRGGSEVSLTNVWPGISPIISPVTERNKLISFDGSFNPKSLSQPYWLKEKHPIGMYTVNDQQLIGFPEDPGVSARFTFNIAGKSITFERPIVYKYTDQVRGELYRPLVVAAPVTASMTEKAFVFNGNESKQISVQLKSFQDGATGTLVPVVPVGWKVSPEKFDFKFSRKGEEQSLILAVTPGGSTTGGTLALNVNVGGSNYQQGVKVLDYEHIPVQTLFPLAEASVNKIDLKFAGKRVGYIAGAGDLIPESLRQIGYEVINLTESQVVAGDLSGFDAIITGVRLYNVSENLRAMQPKLMKYVENGGVLLVQYNVNSPLKIENMGPYPFRLSRDRVTEEDAKVTFLNSKDQSLNYPNRITNPDFEGWIQERGLYFVSDADAKYTSVLSMNDTGESAKSGSLIVADYGKGRYVYTGISFFRQLPAGVPGAYRLFVNLISNQKK